MFLDDQTNEPEWAAVKTGLFGSHVSLVPLAAAQRSGDDLRVPYSKDQVKAAPHHDAGAALSQADEVDLFEYYAIPCAGGTVTAAGSPNGNRESDVQVAVAGDYDISGPTTDDAMTRSEEELRVGRRTAESGRARLRKYIVTEHVTRTVPVSHEEVRIEREPITDANRDRAHDGPALSEEEHEIVLHEERPVVEKEVVARERVRLGTATVTEQAQIDETLRREQIDVTGAEQQR